MRTVDPEKHEARRRQILEAAALCFARRGFHQTRTAEICAEAGMSPGNVFHYFAGKDDIIAAIVDEAGSEMAARFALTEGETDAIAAMMARIDASLAQATDPLEARITLEVVAEAVRNPAMMDCVARNEAVRRTALAGLLEWGQAQGQLAAGLDIAAAVDWILMLLDGYFDRAVIDPAFDTGGARTRLRASILHFLRGEAA
ncbi:TetR/AcrR family transcriptional regulator [Microvirgula aerodenitrificans]|uniref:TetR/AcrR family transcriptional regulator n=1 Tax=Microvirgula aerodenitrificans TaxID=57480 RepID=UPI00248D9455|nr:TetR/AcrR family transcriptional regulator [Microvirgula aerodenitrificans]